MNVYEIITGENYDPSVGWCVQRAIYEAFGVVVDDERDLIHKDDMPALTDRFDLQLHGPGAVMLRAEEPVVVILIQHDQDTDHAVSGRWKDLACKEIAGVITANPTKYPI